MATYLNETFTTNKVKEDINQPATAFLLLWNNDVLCGYIKLVWRHRPDIPEINEKQLEIARLYADKQFIGKGLGKQLMEAAIDFARHGNATCIWLDVWK